MPFDLSLNSIFCFGSPTQINQKSKVIRTTCWYGIIFFLLNIEIYRICQQYVYNALCDRVNYNVNKYISKKKNLVPSVYGVQLSPKALKERSRVSTAHIQPILTKHRISTVCALVYTLRPFGCHADQVFLQCNRKSTNPSPTGADYPPPVTIARRNKFKAAKEPTLINSKKCSRQKSRAADKHTFQQPFYLRRVVRCVWRTQRAKSGSRATATITTNEETTATTKYRPTHRGTIECGLF